MGITNVDILKRRIIQIFNATGAVVACSVWLLFNVVISSA